MSTLRLPDGTLAEDVHEWRRVHRRHIRSQPGFSRLRKNDQRIALHVGSVQGYAMGDGRLMADESQVAKALKLSRKTITRALRVPDPKRGRAPGTIIAEGVLGADPPRWDVRFKRRLPNVYRLPDVPVLCPSALSQESAIKSTLYVDPIPSVNGNGHDPASAVGASAFDPIGTGTSRDSHHHGEVVVYRDASPPTESSINGNGRVLAPSAPRRTSRTFGHSHGDEPNEVTLDAEAVVREVEERFARGEADEAELDYVRSWKAHLDSGGFDLVEAS